MSARMRFGWVGVLTRILVLLGSLASVAGAWLSLVNKPDQLSTPVVFGLALAGAFAVTLVFLEIRAYKPYRVFRHGKSKAINRYMYKWIDCGGRVAVWTRDMTWANTPKMKGLLKTKASNNELVLCIAKPTALTDQLSDAGAEVRFYGQHLNPAISRFTITNYEKDGSSVAVGRAVGRSHVIEEFEKGHHPAYHIAEDLVNLLRAISPKLGPSP